MASCIAVGVCFLTNPVDADNGKDNGKENAGDEISITTIDALRKLHPQYFDLDVSKGLDIYVYQMAKDCNSFILLPHAEPARDWTSEEMLNLCGTNVTEMRQILSTYDLDRSDIRIIPWQHPFSSYIGECDLVGEGEDLEDKRADYMKLIEYMLFDESARPDPILDSMIFDIDGDGEDEKCELS